MGEKRVLHVEERFHPGMGYQINFFARYHHPGYEFVILTSRSTKFWSESLEEVSLRSADSSFELKYGVSIRRLPCYLDRKSKNNLWIRGLNRAIRKAGPDILFVHALESYSAIRVALSRRSMRKYTVFFDTHTLLNQFQEGARFRMLMWVIRSVVRRRIIKYDARVFATVPENRKILTDIYRIPVDRILYTPIGTDLSIFSYSAKAREEYRKREGLNDHSVLVLYTGKMDRRKNPHLILRAVSLIEKRIQSPLCLIFIGRAEELYLEQEMQTHFSGEWINVRLKDAVPVSELHAWYSAADFAVFPDENTLSALDAQACGLPVIMKNDSTNSERLEKGGLLYEPGDLDDLSEKVIRLVKDPAERKELGNAGSIHMREKYDYQQIVKNLEKDLGL